MRAAFGAVGGALAVGAMLVAYNLGERRTFSHDAVPAMQMVVGADGLARPYLVPSGQAGYSATAPSQPSMYQALPMPQALMPAMTPSFATYSYQQPPPYFVPAGQQYVAERVGERPVTRRVSSERTAVAPKRSWQKSALLIGGSAGAGAGLGAIMGGKKGALAGAAIGGGAAALFDQIKRH